MASFSPSAASNEETTCLLSLAQKILGRKICHLTICFFELPKVNGVGCAPFIPTVNSDSVKQYCVISVEVVRGTVLFMAHFLLGS